MSAQKFLYEHGLPFSEIIGWEIDDARHRIMRERKASAFIIDGGVGQGKTTLAVHIAEAYQGKPLVFEEQLAMGGKDFMEKMKICYEKGHPVIVYDEAGDFASRRSVTSFNHYLNRVFDVYRVFKILVIICLPSFAHVDRALMDKQILRVLYHCYGRTNKYGRIQAYDLWKMFYLREKMRKLTVTPSAYRFERPIYHAQFLNLTPERSRALDRYTAAGKIDIVGDVEIKEEGLLSIEDVQKRMREQRTRRWIYGKLSALKISPVKRYKRKNYYHPTVVNKLEAVLG